MTFLIQSLVDAISFGGLYALVALGLGITFGIMRLVNFAHGSLITIGGYLLFSLVAFPPLVAIIGALAGVALAAVLIERTAFRPVRDASPATLLITSFAMSYGLQNLIMIIYSPQPKGFVISDWLTETVTIGDVQIARLSLITIGLTVVVVTVLAYLLKRTRTGIQMLAAADDFRMARLLGVSAHRIITVGFVLSGVLAAIVSVVLVAQTGGVSPTLGVNALLLGLIGIVLGGMDRLVGATIGGFIVGFLVSGLNSWLPYEIRPFRDAFVIGFAVLIILFRPQGLFARDERRVV